MKSSSARYVQWGRGKWHVQRDDEDVTVCGQDVPEDVRATIHSPILCSRCRKDEEAVEAAETDRKARWEEADQESQKRLDENRAGRFLIIRCKLCGLQHMSVPRAGQGTPYCLREMHPSELEVVEATGAPWDGPHE